jgi:hypothetical protein
MRIVIEHDTSRNNTSIDNVASGSSGGADAHPGGAGPGAGGGASSDASGAENAGGPPQWLVDAVSEAQAAAGDGGVDRPAGFEDGGAGPASGAAERQGERK